MPRVKAEVKKVAKKTTVKTEPKTAKVAGLSVSVYGLDGKSTGRMELPEEFFGGKINKALMAQAVRIYLANQRQGNASTKTRGEVEGSSKKIYRQKGTGRARHGTLRAPIFVKGGIVFGPKPRDFSLDMPKKMKRAAVISALSAKLADGEVRVISGLERIEPKTKNMVKLISAISEANKGRTLLVTSGYSKDGLENVFRASRNIKNLDILSANLINTYELLNNKQILFMKQAIEVISKNLGKEVK